RPRAVRAGARRLPLRADHHRDRGRRRLLLRRAVPPAVPREEPGRLLPRPQNGHLLPGRPRDRVLGLTLGAVPFAQPSMMLWTSATWGSPGSTPSSVRIGIRVPPNA